MPDINSVRTVVVIKKLLALLSRKAAFAVVATVFASGPQFFCRNYVSRGVFVLISVRSSPFHLVSFPVGRVTFSTFRSFWTNQKQTKSQGKGLIWWKSKERVFERAESSQLDEVFEIFKISPIRRRHCSHAFYFNRTDLDLEWRQRIKSLPFDVVMISRIQNWFC